jgi:glycolate oxidase
VVVTEPGVTNLAISQAVAHAGFYYAPDPSSQIACSIGGNVAENSGGVHCLKYGMTTNNVLGCEIVLMSGEILRIGGKARELRLRFDGHHHRLRRLLGVITEITVRILQKPETARALMVGFAEVEAAGECVARIIGNGIIPGGMEMMDKPAIHAAEAFVHAGYPLDVEALLIIELDGPGVEVDELIKRVEAIAQACGSTTCQISTSEAERNLFWAGRKAAFPAVGRISPDYLCMDGTIPRGALPKALARIRDLSAKYDLRVANVFHAGDGNLHPLILYDANQPGEMERAEAFGADILRACVEFGGVLTGEHGVGIEKRDLMPEMFSEIDLNQQQRLKCAFDAQGLLNPGKVFPTLHRCAELGRMHVHGGKLAFPDIAAVLGRRGRATNVTADLKHLIFEALFGEPSVCHAHDVVEPGIGRRSRFKQRRGSEKVARRIEQVPAGSGCADRSACPPGKPRVRHMSCGSWRRRQCATLFAHRSPSRRPCGSASNRRRSRDQCAAQPRSGEFSPGGGVVHPRPSGPSPPSWRRTEQGAHREKVRQIRRDRRFIGRRAGHGGASHETSSPR